MSELKEPESEEVNFTHEEVMEITTTTLNELLAQDTLLNDLPKGVTLDEVNNQIALQYGRSITIYIQRGDGEEIPVVVKQSGGRVSDIKKSFMKSMELRLKRDKAQSRKKLSWKYIWKTYYLQHNDIILKEDNKLLSDVSIKNKSRLCFVKRLKDKMTNR